MGTIAIFASGNGSNTERIIRYFQQNPSEGKVTIVLSNREQAKVLERACKLGIDTFVFNSETMKYNPKLILDKLAEHNIDLIVLAGFMMMISPEIISAYENRIINIHPSLLPKFGGKGMYGSNVHKAVIAAGEIESGITIHYVSNEYDKGNIIFQTSCSITSEETPESLEHKIHQLEYEHYPAVISTIINKQL